MSNYRKYSKRKRRGTIKIYHVIPKEKTEFDYDKLAESIVKAQEKSESESKTTKKIGFWKSVWLIIRNKEPKSGNTTAYVLAEVMAWIFNVIAICALILFAFLGYVIIMRLDWNFDLKIEWAYFIAQMFLSMFLLGTSLTISLIFRAVANDIKAEKDRNYITTLFFGFTSHASLIVALVALFKGVG